MPSEFVTLTDGSTERIKGVDQGAGLAAAMVVAVGAGVAGTPAGGVTSVQGVAGGTVLPVSDGGGSITVDGTVALGAGAVTIGKVDQGTGGASAWKVDGSAVTQPVSDGGGSLTVDGAVTVTGGALDATLTNGTQTENWLPSAAATYSPSLFTNLGANAVPAFPPFLVPGSGSIVIDDGFFTRSGLHFSAGLAFAFSTAPGTYVAGAASDQMTGVTYK